MSKNDFPIIDKLGGRKAVVALLQAAGTARVSENAIRMWVARRRIPGRISLLLMVAAEERGVRIEAADFYVDPGQATSGTPPTIKLN